MKQIGKLEFLLASWYGRLPHLPEKGRRWIADNCWWIVLVGVILLSLNILGVLGILLAGTMLLSVAAGVYGAMLGGVVALLALVWIALYILTTVLLAMAVGPLKLHKKRGWKLLFLVTAISVIVEISYVFVSADVGSFIGSMIGTAVGAYFLFEIREYFAVAADAPQTTLATNDETQPEFKPVQKSETEG